MKNGVLLTCFIDEELSTDLAGLGIGDTDTDCWCAANADNDGASYSNEIEFYTIIVPIEHF